MPFASAALGDGSKEVIRRAAVLLGQCGDLAAVPHLIAALVTRHVHRVRVPGSRHPSFAVARDGTPVHPAVAQGFGVPAFPVDTHIHRLAARWGLSYGRNVAKTERDLKAVFPEGTWARRHLQIIYFGREHCPARFHDMSECPICSVAATKAPIRAERQS